jgi:stress response protein YsnF
MTTQVITPEELTQVQSLQSRRDQLTIDFGYIEFQIQELELKKESLVDALTQLKNEEIQVGKIISEKYGEGSINITKGEFTSSN